MLLAIQAHLPDALFVNPGSLLLLGELS